MPKVKITDGNFEMKVMDVMVKKNMSGVNLARKLGLTVASVASTIHNNSPTDTTIEKFAKVLKVKKEDLV